MHEKRKRPATDIELDHQLKEIARRTAERDYELLQKSGLSSYIPSSTTIAELAEDLKSGILPGIGLFAIRKYMKWQASSEVPKQGWEQNTRGSTDLSSDNGLDEPEPPLKRLKS